MWLPTARSSWRQRTLPRSSIAAESAGWRSHAVLFVIVNGFFVGQWLLVRDAPLEDADARALASFWPAWLMLLWGVVLGIHGLYVWAHKPVVEIEAPRPVSWRFGRAVRTVVFTDIAGRWRM